MRTIALFAASLLLVATASAQMQAPGHTIWHSDLELAKQHARQTGQLVLVHFWAPWCAPCKELESSVFAQPGFEQALSSICVPVKLNVDEHAAVVAQYRITQIPADVLITPDGQVVDQMQSPATLVEYLTRVKQVALQRTAGANPYAAMPAAAAAGYAAGTMAGQPAAPAGYAPPAQQQPLAPPAQQYVPPQQQMAAAPPYGAPESQMMGQPPAGVAPHQQPAPGAMPPAATNPYAMPGAAATAAAMTPPDAMAPPMNNYGAAPPAQPPASPAMPPAAPPQPAPVGMDGYCPVTLCELHQWTPGNPAWGVQYRGRTYLFASEEAKQKFWQNPDRFAPIASGMDPVLAIDHHQDVPGQRACGVFFEDRVYLFANEQSLAVFKQNPDRYATEILQARR